MRARPFAAAFTLAGAASFALLASPLAAQGGAESSGVETAEAPQPPAADSILRVEADGASLYAESFGGDGPAVVLLHGFGAQWRPTQWTYMLHALLPQFRVIGVDIRGHGRSDKPHEAEAYGTLLADDVMRVLDAAGVERAHVVGYSLGGIIALKTAARHPDRVASTTLLGQGWLSSAELRGMAEGARQLLAVDTTALPEHQREGFRRNDVTALVAMAQSYPELFVSPRELSELPGPFLAVVGSLDDRMPRALLLAGEHPRTRVETLEGRTHGSVIDDRAYADAIGTFVRAVESGNVDALLARPVPGEARPDRRP